MLNAYCILKFDKFTVGYTFSTRITINGEDFEKYMSFAKTRNILYENSELAAKEGINGTIVPGRAIVARAEGEMTRLDIFSGNIMLLYGMDGDSSWNNRHTRFLAEVYTGEELEVRYIISDKKDEDAYGILSIDFEVSRVRDGKLVVVSRRNLYRIKK